MLFHHPANWLPILNDRLVNISTGPSGNFGTMPGGYDDDNRSISSHDGVYMGGSGSNNNQGMMFNDGGGGGGGGGNNNGMGNHHEMRLDGQGQGLGPGSDFMTTPTSPSLNSMNPDNPYSSMHDSKIKFSHTISHINPTAAAGNNRMLCSVDSLPVEIIPNSRSDLCFLGFLEEISQVMNEMNETKT